MPSLTMWTMVLQTTAIYSVSHILTHHASENIFRNVWENPAVMNFTAMAKNTTIPSNATISTSATTPKNSLSVTKDGSPIDEAAAEHLMREAFDSMRKGDEPVELPVQITLKNGTVLNETISIPKAKKPEASKEQEPFYTKELPLYMITSVIMCTLQYWWLLGLERALPARSRRLDVVVKEKGEMDEDREEEVVKKWIAQGRVRRASLNWCNTLLKWILSLTVGRVWYYVVLHVVGRSLRLQSPRKTWEDMLETVAINYVGSLLYITPLAELIAFVAVPAYKQMLFVAGADLACHIFLVTVVGKLANWAVQTQFAQDVLRNVTEGMSVHGEQEAVYRKFKNEL